MNLVTFFLLNAGIASYTVERDTFLVAASATNGTISSDPLNNAVDPTADSLLDSFLLNSNLFGGVWNNLRIPFSAGSRIFFASANNSQWFQLIFDDFS